MIKRKILLNFCALVLAAALLAGCSDSGEDDINIPGVGLPLSVIVSGTAKSYYSLTTGQAVADPAGDWDIGFFAADSTCSILTNSGVTAAAAGSSGLGGVHHTGMTNFASVTAANAVIPGTGDEYEPYVQDVKRWATVMSGSVELAMNIMTYLGYPSGDGLDEATTFTYNSYTTATAYEPYNFNKMQFYKMKGMPPAYTTTNQVYIITRHDGVAKSKVQITGFRYVSATSTFEVDLRYENLP
jgi:hypothetical protein